MTSTPFSPQTKMSPGDYPQPGVLRVLQTRQETSGFHDRTAGRSRISPEGLIMEAFERTHRRSPNYPDCCPIQVRRALEDAGFHTTDFKVAKTWVDVEIVRGVDERPRPA